MQSLGAFSSKRRRAESRTRTGDLFITNEVLYQLSYFGNLAIQELLVNSQKRCKGRYLFRILQKIAKECF